MAACHILGGPTSSVHNKLHLVLGFVIGAKKPLHRAGACVTVMKEKVYIRCGISEEEGSMVSQDLEL
jgi:hypothetical protein